MKLIRSKQTQDPVKSSIYNPKQFRSPGRQHIEQRDHDAAQPARWPLMALVFFVAAIGYGSWTGQFQGIESRLGAMSMVGDIWPLSKARSPSPLPKTGLLEDIALPAGATAPLRLLGNREGKHCLVRLIDWNTGKRLSDAFVKAGESVVLQVPLGRYRIEIACGTQWFGDAKFGPGTKFDHLIAPMIFTRDQNGQAHGMMIDLTSRPGGNLPSI